MIYYLLRRIAAAVPVLAVVAVFVFMLLRLTPGDPAAILAGDIATPEQIERIRNSLGLNQSIATQFYTWLGQLLVGDFGTSILSKTPVIALVGDRAPPTIWLALITITLSVAVAVPMGVVAAWRHKTWIDHVVMTISVLGFSIPAFVIGYLLIKFFAIDLKLLPVQGYIAPTKDFFGFLQRMVLPALTLASIYIALIARMTRAALLDVLNEDYIRTARAKGIAERKVL